MWESVGQLLEWVDQYGADKVFMVAMFIMYIRSQKRIAKVQDARLADNKEAVAALIEARHALDEAHDITEEVSDVVKQHSTESTEQFGKLRGKLDRLEVKTDAIKEAIQAKP